MNPLRPESLFAGRRWHNSPEDDPNIVSCPQCGEDTWDDGTPRVECANGELREPRVFPGVTAFPVRRAA